MSPSGISYQNSHIWLSTRLVLVSDSSSMPTQIEGQTVWFASFCQVLAGRNGIKVLFTNTLKTSSEPGNLEVWLWSLTLVPSFLQNSVSYTGLKHLFGDAKDLLAQFSQDVLSSDLPLYRGKQCNLIDLVHPNSPTKKFIFQLKNFLNWKIMY